MELRIVGVGIHGTSQITLEGLRAVQTAACVVYFAIADEHVRALLDGHGVDARDIGQLYEDGGVDLDNYERIMRAVMRALDEHGTVALLLYGHPRVGVWMTGELERRVEAAGGRVRVHVAPSSFDTMMNDLRRDPLQLGTALLDANRLLLFRYPINPYVDQYVYHVCSVGTPRTNVSSPATANRLDLLQRYLTEYFPPEHEVVFLCSSGVHGETLLEHRRTIGTLLDELPELTFGTTLFIPARKPQGYDRDFFALLSEGKSVAELRREEEERLQ